MTPLVRGRLSGHDALLSAARRQAGQTTDFYRRNRRLLRFVDTHQKWLLIHLLSVVASTMNSVEPGVAVNWVSDRAVETGIASRNTTLAFFHQLHAYGYLTRTACQTDRRIKRVALSLEAEGVLAEWAVLLLDSLDLPPQAPALTGLQALSLYRRLAQLLLAMPQWIAPPQDIRLTQDVRGGWLVMNHIVDLIETPETAGANLPVRDFSVGRLAQTFSLSRSTLYRLLAHAVEAGTMEFDEVDGIPTLSVNAYHLRQYCRWNGHLLAAVEQAAAERLPAPIQMPQPLFSLQDHQVGMDLLPQLATI